MSSQKGPATPAIADSLAFGSKPSRLSQDLDNLRKILSGPETDLGALRAELRNWESDFRTKLEELVEQRARLRDEIMRWQMLTAEADAKLRRTQTKLDAALAKRTATSNSQPEPAQRPSQLAGEPKQDKSSVDAEDRLSELQSALREFYTSVVNPITVAVASVQLLAAGHSLAAHDRVTLAEIQESLNGMLQGFRKFAAQLSTLGVVDESSTEQQGDSPQGL